MSEEQSLQQEDEFILLPKGDFRGNQAQRSFLGNLPMAQSTGEPQIARLSMLPGKPEFLVLDTVHEDGPKLVKMNAKTAEQLNRDARSPMRTARITYFDRPNPPLGARQSASGTGNAVTIHCKEAGKGMPVAAAYVVAFTDFKAGSGDEGVTDSNGDVQLGLGPGKIERIYVYSPTGYWGAYRANVSSDVPVHIELEPVDLAYEDCLRYYYGASKFDSTVGVRVGIIDSGVGPHSDLNIVTKECRNTVTGEPNSDYLDGDTHGTHVAGIVGSSGSPPHGLRGVAPGVEIVALRVFPPRGGASNYAIMKALVYAGDARCDIANLSLGGGPADEIVQEAIDDARDQGMLIVAAAGNEGRKPVNFPAAYGQVIGVSAMGHERKFLAGSLEEGEIERPPKSNSDPAEFFAGFSNIGAEINCVGPGVGVLSTLPNDLFGPESGTSMAAPAVSGAVACLLSQSPQVYRMARDAQRANAIWNVLVNNCDKRGFGADFEGLGLPDPAIV